MKLSSFANLLPRRSDYTATKKTWRFDLLAGLTVGIVALPLALAFGVSSGVGAEAGLITAIIAGLVAAIFGGSNIQVSGPTGAMVVVLLPIVVDFGVQYVATVAIIAGVLVLAAGIFKLGRTIGYVPWPVIEGFTVGIGIIIFLQQFPSAFDVNGKGNSTNAVVAAWQVVRAATWPQALIPLAVAAAVAAIMTVLTKWRPGLPASIIALGAVSVVVTVANIPVARIGELPSSLPSPSLPTFDFGTVTMLLPAAFAVAILAGIESLLSARVAASISDTGPYEPDRELVGQGLASIAAGFFGGMPATGAIARTAVNVRSGGRTRLSSITHSLVLLAVVYLATNLVSTIPLSALAGVLMVTAARMVSPLTIKTVMKASRSDALVFAVTALITVSVDLIVAVGIGIAVAGILALRALSSRSGVHRVDLPGPPQPGDERIALFRIDGSLFFAAAEKITEEIWAQAWVDVVILRLSQIQGLDSTGAHSLSELIVSLERNGITVLVKGIKREHLGLMQHLGVIGALRDPKHLFEELPAAVTHARKHTARSQTGTVPNGASEAIPTTGILPTPKYK